MIPASPAAERRLLSPDEKAEFLARMRAKYPVEEPEWRDLGAELDDADEMTDEPGSPGLAALFRLFTLIDRHRPAWQRDALCQEPEYVDLPWFPNGRTDAEAVKAVCARCLVAEECTAYAVDQGITAGCWGGVVGKALRAGHDLDPR